MPLGIGKQLKKNEDSQPSRPTSTAGKDQPKTPAITSIQARMDDAEKKLSIFDKSLTFVQDTNRYILIILFMGFLAILISSILGIIQASNSSASTQIEFIKSIEELRNEVNNLNDKLYRATQSGAFVLQGQK